MTDAHPNPIRRFIGLPFVTIGALWIAASGLCSAGLLVYMLADTPHLDEILGMLPMILLVGGFSAGIGYVFYIIGRALRPNP
jgi:drug/metabolite transporter (DMT)-like permease